MTEKTLVERLREVANGPEPYGAEEHVALMLEAAERIEELEQAIKRSLQSIAVADHLGDLYYPVGRLMKALGIGEEDWEYLIDVYDLVKPEDS